MKNKQRKESIILFCAGCLLGILCFVAIYGVKILNVTYDGWLLKGDVDLMQHYVGWGHFRNNPWSFPIGLISSLSEPYSMSVIFTDSIPIMAVFFKLLSPILPETFQYFGLYGLLCFALQGGIGMLLLNRLVKRRWVMVLSVFFLIMTFPILQRLYYHTALASQWLILLALLFWFETDENTSLLRSCVKWGFLGFLCVGIHSYFLPMCGGIMAMAVIEQWVVCKKISGTIQVGKQLIRSGLQIGAFCGMGILNLWVLGGLYGGASAVGGGIGSFESNLNTFVNPLGHGITGASLPIYNEFQYEGFGYLGLGMILLTMISLFIGLYTLIVKRKGLKNYLLVHHRQVLIACTFVIFVLMAACPILTLGSHKLIGIPLPGKIRDIADIFRSNGRFIWVSMYLIMLSVMKFCDRVLTKPFGAAVLVLAFALQIVDLYGDITDKQYYFNLKPHEFTSVWEGEEMEKVIAGKDSFILMDSNLRMMLDTGYYAFTHHMTTNCFYFARDIDARIEEQREAYKEELRAGLSRKDAVYVFPLDDFSPAEYPDLIFYEMKDYFVGVSRP